MAQAWLIEIPHRRTCSSFDCCAHQSGLCSHWGGASAREHGLAGSSAAGTAAGSDTNGPHGVVPNEVAGARVVAAALEVATAEGGAGDRRRSRPWGRRTPGRRSTSECCGRYGLGGRLSRWGSPQRMWSRPCALEPIEPPQPTWGLTQATVSPQPVWGRVRVRRRSRRAQAWQCPRRPAQREADRIQAWLARGPESQRPELQPTSPWPLGSAAVSPLRGAASGDGVAAWRRALAAHAFPRRSASPLLAPGRSSRAAISAEDAEALRREASRLRVALDGAAPVQAPPLAGSVGVRSPCGLGGSSLVIGTGGVCVCVQG